jgi:N-methylhydantoinase A/oxoprolinase/acetone carboxylase beta subunit
LSIVGIDIGGTFIDLVGYQDGGIIASKCLTVPADPTEGAAQALRIAGCNLSALDELLHGSTIAINSVLEKSGVRTPLITTRGFRAGGGGWGDPHQRSREAIDRDIPAGYVSRAAALRDYGYVPAPENATE